MPKKYEVTPEVLSKFKEPFGELIQGTANQTISKLKDRLKTENPVMIIAVGDAVSRNLNKNQIPTQLSITDNRSHRRHTPPQIFPNKKLINVKNPQGTITVEAIEAIRDAIAHERQVHLLVEGEEDLLTVVAVLYAPKNTWVVYGQPHKGVVVVKVTAEKKIEAECILNEMKKTE